MPPKRNWALYQLFLNFMRSQSFRARVKLADPHKYNNPNGRRNFSHLQKCRILAFSPIAVADCRSWCETVRWRLLNNGRPP